MPKKCGSSRVDELASRSKVTQTKSFPSSLLMCGTPLEGEAHTYGKPSQFNEPN